MLTKSKIQLIREALAHANDYREGLENLTNKYLIEDSIFVYKNNQVMEVTQGYFVKKEEYDNLLEAVRGCNCEFEKYGIRIINNEKYIVGVLKNSIVECGQNVEVFDVNRLTNIR